MASSMEFVKMCEGDPHRAVWVDRKTGKERIMAAPRRYRPKCIAPGNNGKGKCGYAVRPFSPFCRMHQPGKTETSLAPTCDAHPHAE